MKKYKKFIATVLAVSAASYLLQLAWIHIVEPVMEACGVAFHGILPTGDLIGGAAVVLILSRARSFWEFCLTAVFRFGCACFTMYCIRCF